METPLQMMLWMDAQYAHAAALPDCLGDAYLYALNPVFRGVRDLALAHGVTYRAHSHPLVNDYALAPLLELPAILDSGIVPYFANADLLRRLVAAHPNTKLLAEEIGLVKPNYHMHESAHVVADRLLAPLPLGPVEKSILGESFANAVDATSAVYATVEAHRSMHAINSYMAGDDPDRLRLLRDLVAAYGFPTVFNTALWIFFFLNVKPHTDNPGPRYLHFVAETILGPDGAADPARRLLISAAPLVFGLSKGFRAKTTPIHFRLAGQEPEYQALREFNFESGHPPSPAVLDGVALLTEVAAHFVA